MIGHLAAYRRKGDEFPTHVRQSRRLIPLSPCLPCRSRAMMGRGRLAPGGSGASRRRDRRDGDGPDVMTMEVGMR
jgi:hypothetical protein